jgi:hypothetical protein
VGVVTALGTRTRPAGCASDLALEELLAGDLDGEPGASLRAHVAGCARCRDRMAALGAEPTLAPTPAAGHEALQVRARARRLRVFAAAGGGVAAAAAAFVVALKLGGGAPDTDGARAKGGLALSVHVKQRDGAITVASGEGRLRPGEEMRFSLALASPGYAVVLGLDAAPSVTVYVPAAGGRAVRVEPPGPVVLPGSIVADDVRGAERVVAVVCGTETPPEKIRQRAEAALAAARGGPAAVSGLGTGCLEASVLLHKDDDGR